MRELLHDIQVHHELIWVLALKELRVRYKRSTLGFLWALLNPLLMMVILSVVFATLIGTQISHYSVFLLSTLLPWTFFSQALSYATDSIVGNGDLLKKVRVAKSVFPMAAVLSNVINFFLSLIPLIVLLPFLHFPFLWTWIYLPIPFLGLTLLALGFSFFFAMANVFFRDVAHILQILLSAWFYMSPIIYPLNLTPQRYRLLFRMNPVLYALNGFRLAIYYGLIPTPQSVAMTLGCGLVSVYIGHRIFRRYQDSLVFYV
jgi:ABC-2 type transport system permease protein